MIVRKIRREDLGEHARVHAVAFNRQYRETTWEEALAEAERKADPRRPWQDRWCAFLDDDRTMISALSVLNYTVRFDGRAVGMAGVAGVATLPEHRRQGAVRACMGKAFEEMRARGQVFSHLYPFSTAYYEKFGYESAVWQAIWRMPLAAIRRADVPGALRTLRPGESVEALRAVYDACAEEVNHMVLRGDAEWEEIRGSLRSEEGLRRACLYTRADGTPGAYMLFERKTEDNGRRTLSASELFCRDFEGFSALMQYAKAAEPQCDDVSFALPAWFRAEKAFAEYVNPTWRSTRFRGQTRVIDVERALRLARFRGSGEAALRIRDAQCPWNDATFRVAFENGAAARVERTGGAPDADLSIGDFTALISGRYAPEDWAYLPDAAFPGDREALAKIFYPKRCFIADRF